MLAGCAEAVACMRHAAWTSGGCARSVLYVVSCTVCCARLQRAPRPLGAQRCVRRRPVGARLDRSASQRTLASAAPASGAVLLPIDPPGPSPYSRCGARLSARCIRPCLLCRSPAAHVRAGTRSLVGSHARASARATQTRADGGWKLSRQPHGALCREHWRAGGAERAVPGVPQRVRAVRAPRVLLVLRLPLTARVRRRAEDRSVRS